MTDTVAQMTREEFREMIEVIVEQKLAELLGDPDEGLKIRDPVRSRLLKQKKPLPWGNAAKLWRT